MKDTLFHPWIWKPLISMSGEKFKGHNPHILSRYNSLYKIQHSVTPVSSLKMLMTSLPTAQTALQIHADSATSRADV